MNRVAILGLDGVPFSLLERYCAEGVMPRLAELAPRGHFGPITASIPEISSVSWTTFMTGAGPGRHGIYGFMDFQPGSYNFYFPNATHNQAPPVWKRIEDAGLESVVLNMPATYPAQPMRGALVSGFVSVDLAKAVYPPELHGPLAAQGYLVDMDLMRARKEPDYLFESLYLELEQRRAVAERLLAETPWSFAALVVTGTDRLHHFQMEAAFDPAHPFHQRFRDYYSAVDEFVGWFHDLVTASAPGTLLAMLSDHGFTRLESEVYVNALLRREGYLHYASPQPRTIQEIGPDTKAFCLDPSRVYINRRGKYPLGCVAPHEVAALKAELTELFLGLRHEGRPVLRAVHDGLDIYSGPCAAQAPDLVLLSHPGFDLKANVAKAEVFGTSGLGGMHTWDDAFCWMSDAALRPASIADFADIFLKHLGQSCAPGAGESAAR